MPDQGNVVIVTGANRGIGLAIAERLSHDRYEIAACVRSRSSELEQLLYQSDDQNDRHKIFEMDLANKDSIREAVKSIFAWKRQVVALVNCAGMAQGSLFSMTRMTDLQTVFEVNYFAQIYLTQLVVKKMIRAKSGSIVNIASTAGILADAGTLSYGCSKAALIHASKIMATELGVYGIRVNAVAPSVVETDMANLMDENARAKLDNRSVLSGLIYPEDVAGLVSYLVSDHSNKITGQVIRIDRGLPF